MPHSTSSPAFEPPLITASVGLCLALAQVGAFVVMAYIVMAYIGMACIVMAYIVMACIVMAE